MRTAALSGARGRPSYLLQIVRSYWGAVENGIHLVRDNVLWEDACRVRKGALPRVSAALTNVTLTILRLVGVGDSKHDAELLPQGLTGPEDPARLSARAPSNLLLQLAGAGTSAPTPALAGDRTACNPVAMSQGAHSACKFTAATDETVRLLPLPPPVLSNTNLA